MKHLPFLVALLLIAGLSFSVNVSSCQVITAAGTYTLNQSVSGAPNDASEVLAASKACIKIASSGVTFDCKGFSISNNGTLGTTYGILLNGSASGVTVQNCPKINNSYVFGVYLFNSDSNTIINNTATNDSNGFKFDSSENNTVTNNNAAANAGRGFDAESGSSDNTFSGNNATGNGQEGFIAGSGSDDNIFLNNIASFSKTQGGFTIGGISGGSSGNTFTNNVAQHNTGTGFSIVSTSGNNTLTNNTVYNNTLDGFFLQGSSGNVFIMNNVTGNGQSGFTVQIGSDQNLFVTNTMTGNGGEGLRVVASANNTLVSNNASGNGRGFVLQTGSLTNTLVSNTAYGNTYDGFRLADSANNSLISNTAFNQLVPSQGTGFFFFPDSDGNSIIANNAYNNSLYGFSMSVGCAGNQFIANNGNNNTEHGFFLSFSSDNNTMIANNALGNGLEGFILSDTSVGNNLTANTAAGNGQTGFTVINSPGNMLLSNNASGNSIEGIVVSSSADSVLLGDTASGNGGSGIKVSNSNRTTLTREHLFNNTPDFTAQGGASPFILNMTEVIFDSPAGNYTNYTNLSVNDSVEASSSYTMRWSPPIALPGPAVVSFAGKFLNITAVSGAPVIDSAAWTWLDSELGTSNESRFKLWKYNGTWNVPNTTPDTVQDTLSLSNMSSFSTFAILEDILLPPGGGGAPGGEVTPTLSVSFNQSTGVATVTSGGSPVAGATVKSDGVTVGLTDAAGQITIPGCNDTANLDATKTGYHAASGSFALKSCGPTPGCVSDSDCAADQKCQGGMCALVQCGCGFIENHQCTAYACCSDSDCGVGQLCADHSCKPKPQCTSDAQCAGTQVCDIPPGSAGGACKDLTGKCGQAKDHKFVPYGYECGAEPGCPSCPEGKQCADHKCVGNDLTCPSSGVVGGTTTCRATEGTQSCQLCDYRVTDPLGKTFGGKTDDSGNMELPLNLEGTYKVALLKDGKVIKEIFVQALPKAGGGEGTKPTSTGPDSFTLLWLLILVIGVIAAIFYWRSRGQKRA
ncbi:MAG: NosD domain-containing protein [Candidatus Micrarchaeia archaeon]